MSKEKIISLDSLSLQDFDSEAELIPLMTPEDEEEMNKEKLPDDLPILPLRNMVLFPGVVIPITAGRDKSIKLINDANSKGKVIGVVSQKEENIENPTANDINTKGTVSSILKDLKMPDGNVTVINQGKKRFEKEQVTTEEPYIKAVIREFSETRPDKSDKEFKAITENVKDLANKIIQE